jgi:hypothetical protein
MPPYHFLAAQAAHASKPYVNDVKLVALVALVIGVIGLLGAIFGRAGS